MNDERRQEPRVPVSLEAHWEGMSGRYEARISDISTRGCFLESPGHVVAGERVAFTIRLPTGEWLRLRGEVMFKDPFMGFGISFVELSDEQRTLLTNLVEFLSGNG